ncbi:MAG TPA: PEGA domain-containing protein [Bryobacteraceae bacterium]|nr:PEGA domain-containing protein [Bryobacteraceae bacterium]
MSIHARCLIGMTTLMLTCAVAIAQQKEAYLKTNVDPGRAGVFVDGKYLGPAENLRVGRKYALPPGQHEVKLVDPRCEDFTTTVTLEAGKTTHLVQTLKPLPAPKPPFGMIRTEGFDKFDAVYVNGKFYGHAGEFNNSLQGLKLPVGEYEVRVERPGASPVTQKVKLEADQTVIVK